MMIPFKTGTVLLFLLLSIITTAAPPLEISREKVKLQFTIDDEGKPVYTVLFNGREVVKPSALGFLLDTDPLFYKDFTPCGAGPQIG